MYMYVCFVEVGIDIETWDLKLADVARDCSLLAQMLSAMSRMRCSLLVRWFCQVLIKRRPMERGLTQPCERTGGSAGGQGSPSPREVVLVFNFERVSGG